MRRNNSFQKNHQCHCSTQPYVCVDTEGQSRTQLNVLHADAAHMQIRHRGDQLAHN
jgi:hypothetical protein